MNMKSTVCSLLLIASLTLLSFSRPLHGDPIIVEVENLTPDLFRSYMLSSLENTEIEILESCVPAKLISITYNGNSNETEETVLQYFSQFQNSGSVKILNDYTMIEFTNKCQQARLGK